MRYMPRPEQEGTESLEEDVDEVQEGILWTGRQFGKVTAIYSIRDRGLRVLAV
jgi:hypothetical protein